jgi:PAS domain-containing protein
VTENQIRSDQANNLRRRAEHKARADGDRTPDILPPEEARQLLHELRVYQIELEIQNRELRRTQVELEASRTRYFDLYELAPVGYVTLSERGLILGANLTAATLFGVAKGRFVKRALPRFILPADQDIYGSIYSTEHGQWALHLRYCEVFAMGRCALIRKRGHVTGSCEGCHNAVGQGSGGADRVLPKKLDQTGGTQWPRNEDPARSKRPRHLEAESGMHRFILRLRRSRPPGQT